MVRLKGLATGHCTRGKLFYVFVISDGQYILITFMTNDIDLNMQWRINILLSTWSLNPISIFSNICEKRGDK